MSGPKLSREKLRNCRSAAFKVAAVYAAFGNLIQDLLDLSQVEAGKLRLVNEPLRMDEIFQSCVGMFFKDAQAVGIRLNLDLDDRIPALVRGDKGRLIQI